MANLGTAKVRYLSISYEFDLNEMDIGPATDDGSIIAQLEEKLSQEIGAEANLTGFVIEPNSEERLRTENLNISARPQAVWG